MPIPLMSPLLWEGTPFDDPDAWDDFQGIHAAWHRELAKVTVTPIVALDDLRETLDLHGNLHDAIADALLIPHGEDLRSQDLNDRDNFETFMLIHAADHERLRRAAGL